MTVLQVITDTDRRGAQVFADDLHHALAESLAVRTVALAPGRHGSRLDLPVLGATRLGRGTLAALRREMGRVSVTVAHGSTTLPACALAGFRLPTPFVYRQISDHAFWVDTRAKQLRVTALLRRARMVVALWRGSAEALTSRFGVPAGRVRVIPNGVPATRHPVPSASDTTAARVRFGLHPARPVVLSIGALAAEKGVDLVLRAVARQPDWQLLVVGAGPEQASLERLAGGHAAGQVRFAGAINDPQSAFAAADVVAFPSRGGDSMPAVLIEAAFAQRPCAASPVEGIIDIVVPGRTGELVSSDEPGALAEGLQRCLDRRVAYGHAAREHCLAHFDMPIVAAAWAQVLREAADASAR